MLGKYVLLLLFSIAFFHVNAKPIDEEPKKLTLDIPVEKFNSTNIRVPTRWEKGMELLGQFMDAIRFGTGRLVNFGMMARNEIVTRAEEFRSEAANKILSLIAARDARQYIQKTNKNVTQQQQKRSTLDGASGPVKIDSIRRDVPPVTGESVHLENEIAQGVFEIKKPNPLQNFQKVTPIIDVTKEEDKYGNSGGGGKFIVDGVEGLSNFINILVEFPGTAAQRLMKNVNAALNHLGRQFLGLA